MQLGAKLNQNLYDFGARNYDPALGRWMNIDAFAGAFKSVSPYNYALNNPVVNIDPSGNLTYDWRGLPVWPSNHGQTTFGFAMDGGPFGGGGGGGSDGTWSYNGNGTYINNVTGEVTNDWELAVGETVNFLGGNYNTIYNANETTPIAFGDWDSSVRIGEVKKGVVRNTRRDTGDFLTRTNLAYTAISAYGGWMYRGGRYIQTNENIGNFEKMIKLSKNAKLSKIRASAFKNAGIVGNAITTGIIIYDVAQDGKIQTSNIVNGTLMVIGTVAMLSTAILSAPVIAGIGIVIATYGVAYYIFDIGGSLDRRYGQFNVNPF